MARLGFFAIGLGVAAVAGAAVWLHDPVDSAAHRARECRLVTALEHERMTEQAERARDLATSYWMFRAERVEGRPTVFQPGRLTLRPIDWVLAVLGKKAVSPLDCGPALDAGKVPAKIAFSPAKPRTISRSIYSRAVFWPGDRYALISWTPCDLYEEGWSQKTYPLLLRREGEVWRQVETKNETLLLVTRPYRGRAMPCFAR